MKEHGFKNLMGNDASKQPGHMQELMLHETTVAWMRTLLTETTPKKCWTESREEYTARLKRCADFIKKNYDVEGLCKGLQQRIKSIIKANRGHIPKLVVTVCLVAMSVWKIACVQYR